MEVIGFLAIGYSSKQIDAEIKIAVNTVDNHRQSMLKKTNSKSTGELVNFAIKAGFV
ncbi:MAG: LuxR C-terminal-related transcriptional regulator [Ginsengibacter sp.]|jgi:DNA-binding CsgD family transcriptional regulator